MVKRQSYDLEHSFFTTITPYRNLVYWLYIINLHSFTAGESYWAVNSNLSLFETLVMSTMGQPLFTSGNVLLHAPKPLAPMLPLACFVLSAKKGKLPVKVGNMNDTEVETRGLGHDYWIQT